MDSPDELDIIKKKKNYQTLMFSFYIVLNILSFSNMHSVYIFICECVNIIKIKIQECETVSQIKIKKTKENII